MGLWLGSGLQAANTGLWPRTPSKTCLHPGTPKKPVRRDSILPVSCQNAFPFSVPGGGVRPKLESGALCSGLKFKSVLSHPILLFGRPSNAPKLQFGRLGHQNWVTMEAKMTVRIWKNMFAMNSCQTWVWPIIYYVWSICGNLEI